MHNPYSAFGVKLDDFVELFKVVSCLKRSRTLRKMNDQMGLDFNLRSKSTCTVQYVRTLPPHACPMRSNKQLKLPLVLHMYCIDFEHVYSTRYSSIIESIDNIAATSDNYRLSYLK